MTITERPQTGTGSVTAPELVRFDLYRDIHKGIRTELFAVTTEAGRLDPADRLGRVALAQQTRSVIGTLVSHAEHEDTHMQPAIEAHLPALAAEIIADHGALEARMTLLQEMADEAVDASDRELRARVHGLYLEWASFTSAYLGHQDLEERMVMPGLDALMDLDAVMAVHGAIISSIPPDEMAQSLSFMLPAMNVDDRTELLGGMRANAPAEAFAGVWSLAGSVLRSDEHKAVAGRLGLA